jgi:CCR4-NOT transcription complex subunit 1
VISNGLRQQNHHALECLTGLVDELLLNDNAMVIRTNFAHSFDSLLTWLNQEPELEPASAVLQKLEIDEPSTTLAELPASNKQDEIDVIFDNWVYLNRPGMPEKSVATFIKQLSARGILKDHEQTAVFIRGCLNSAIMQYEAEDPTFGGSIDFAYLRTDALASMIMALITYYGEEESGGPVQLDQPKFLESIMALVILFQCDHYKVRAERANQKVFFRIYSALIYEIQQYTTTVDNDSKLEFYLIISRILLAIQPNYLPGFSFAWLSLLSHRSFFPVMLTMGSELVRF